MADEIPQYSDTQPILQPAEVKSGAEGYEEFAKTLGSIGEKAQDEAQTIASNESKSMYVSSVANMEQVKTSAQINMLTDPNNAGKYSEQASNMLEEIKNNAYVNKGDRAKLGAYATTTQNDVDLKSTETQVKQSQHEAAFLHYSTWQAQNDAYQQLLIHDPKQAEQYHQAMLQNLQNLVSIGAITPKEAGSSIKSMQDTVGLAQDMHTVYTDPDATAKDYHTAVSNPMSAQQNANNDNAGQPINHSTAWMTDYYNSDKSVRGALSSIYNRENPNPQTFEKLSAPERQHVIQAINGVRVADGYINSGEPFTTIQKTYDSLKGDDRVLSYKDQATKHALGNYITDLKNGNYLNVMSKDPQGNAIINNFTSKNAAIENLRQKEIGNVKDPNIINSINQKYTTMALQNKDEMINQSIAWGEGRHIPREYIQPIPQADVAATQNAFNAGQDPNAIVNMVGTYNKQSASYLAQSMKRPEQRMIVQAVSLAGNSIPTQDKLDFIVANQTNVPTEKTVAGVGEEIQGATTDKAIMTRIYAKLKQPLAYVSQNYDPSQAVTLQNAMLQSTLNTAKYLAEKDGNLGKVSDNYIKQASKFYQSAFDTQSSSNWTVNPNSLPAPLSNAQLDQLADYAIHKGIGTAKAALGEDRYNLTQGRNALKMIITPAGDVQAVDGKGTVLYSTPYTNNLVAHAITENKKRAADELAQKNLAREKALPGAIKQIQAGFN